MSARFPPGRGDSHHAPRDRSPARAPDRRPSGHYNAPPPSLRGHNDINYRANDVHSYSGPGREPPRGPKAYLGGSRGGGYVPRGRGYTGRGDARDRDFRDQRDHSAARRGRDQRDWVRRDRDFSRERRPSPTGRNRSRSPGPPRDFRESRDFPPRDIEQDRSRRASREGYGQPSPALSESSYTAGSGNRGGYFGRGRPERDFGRRSRGSFGEEREPWRARSRSRERIWERGQLEERDRDRNQGRDQSFPHRDEPLRKGWDDRERDVGRRETAIHRPELISAAPSQETSHSVRESVRSGQARPSHDARSSLADPSPRLPSNSIASSISTGSREADRSEANVGHPEKEFVSHRASSPPQAPQVPAFGSIVYQPPKPQQQHTAPAPERDEAFDRAVEKPIQGPIVAPSGPKAQFSSNLPTGPRAEHNLGKRPLACNSNTDFSAPRSRGVGPVSKPRTLSLEASSPKDTGFERFHENPRDLPQGPDSPKSHYNRSPSLPSAPRVGDTNRYSNTSNMGAAVSPAYNRGIGYDFVSQASPLKIPTGPRADRNTSLARPPLPSPARSGAPRPPIIPRGPGRGMNLRWVRPGLTQPAPRGPSMMSSMISKKDDSEDEATGAIDSDGDISENERASVTRSEPPTSHPQSERLTNRAPDAEQKGQQAIAGPYDVSIHLAKERDQGEQMESLKLPASPVRALKTDTLNVGLAEEENMDMDEEYLADERKFEETIQNLESKRPASPRHNGRLLSLLDEIDALAIAAEARVDGFDFDQIHHNRDSGKPESPYQPERESGSTNPVCQLPSQPQNVRIATPPLENLPYLSTGPPTPFSDMDDLQDPQFQDMIDAQILQELTARVQLEDAMERDIKDQFCHDYKSWRLSIEAFEEQKKAQQGVTTVSDTSGISILPTAQTTPIVESRRIGRNLSQLDYERALEESKVSANEEEQRRQRITQNTDHKMREASIPPMFTRAEAREATLLDTTNKIDPDDVVNVLGYHPKVDDFSAEEHRLFTEAFLAEPKRFGAIARKIPGRTYQECIHHYYLTKQNKERANGKARRGRGKGVRGGSGRPKAAPQSLISGVFGDDPAVVAVTESGRPRRNAAPTFGNGPDGETILQATTPARRNVSGTKSDAAGETPPEKPGSKRGRAGTGRDKAVRKIKAPLLAAAPGPSPHKMDKEVIRSRSKEPKLENEQQLEEMRGAELLANLSNTQVGSLPTTQLVSDPWSANQPFVVSTSSSVQRPPVEQFQSQLKGGPPTSSYWSVPEQTDFANLIPVFGTNWQAIADHMKTKTQTMVKNYYHRQIERGESKHIEQAATIADEKIKRGEDMGEPPPATIVPKRRYDTGPQIITPRQLAPSVEQGEIERESSALRPAKPTPVSPSQYAQGPQRHSGILQPEPVPKFSDHQSPPQAPTSSSSSRATQQSLQQRVPQPQPGPRAGFFSEPSRTVQPQSHQAQSQQQPQQQSRLQTHKEDRQTRMFADQSRRQDLQELLQKQQRPKEVTELLSTQRRAKQQESQSISSGLQQPTVPLNQAIQARQLSQGSQIRIAPSQGPDVEIRPRLTTQQQFQPQQQQASNPRQDSHHSEALTGARRIESYSNARQTPLQSMSASRPSQPFSPPNEANRPGSVPAATAAQPPKRSNIMNILNDEPAEPQPRKKVSDTRPPAPTPPPQSPAGQLYQQPMQPVQQYARRELQAEPSQAAPQQHHHRSSISQVLSQQPAQTRDALSTNWAEVAQRNYSEQQKTNYQHQLQQQLAESPRMHQPFSQQTSRPPLQAMPRTHAPNPPTSFAHSRASSYASLHSQPQQSQQPSQSSTQATPVLKPSPYAQIQPQQNPQAQHQPQQPQPLPGQYPPQQLQTLQQHQHRDPDAISSHHQQQLMRQQEAMRQRQDPFRQVQPEQIRQQEMQHYQSTIRPQRDMRESNPMMEELARRDETLRREEAMRREELAVRRGTFTPTSFSHNGGYQQQQNRPSRGYEDRRQ